MRPRARTTRRSRPSRSDGAGFAQSRPSKMWWTTGSFNEQVDDARTCVGGEKSFGATRLCHGASRTNVREAVSLEPDIGLMEETQFHGRSSRNSQRRLPADATARPFGQASQAVSHRRIQVPDSATGVVHRECPASERCIEGRPTARPSLYDTLLRSQPPAMRPCSPGR